MALAAYFRGPVDAVSAHVADLALLAPAPLVLVVVSGLTYIGPVQFGLLYGLISGLGGAAIVMRAHALTLMNRPFIDARAWRAAGRCTSSPSTSSRTCCRWRRSTCC